MTMTVMRKRRMNEKKRRGITLATIRERGQRIREEDALSREKQRLCTRLILVNININVNREY